MHKQTETTSNTFTQKEQLIRDCQKSIMQTIPPIFHLSRKFLHRQIEQGNPFSPAQFHILRSLKHGTSTISEIAASEHISPPAISRQVDSLVKMGIVSRQRDPNDRRTVILAITDKGYAFWKELTETSHNWLIERLETLSIEELQSIDEGLQTLHSLFTPDEKQPPCTPSCKR